MHHHLFSPGILTDIQVFPTDLRRVTKIGKKKIMIILMVKTTAAASLTRIVNHL
jgi:hypothetical protein